MKMAKAVVMMCLAAAMAAFVPEAKAASVTYDYSKVWSGTAPGDTAPWLTAMFADVAGGVKLTLSANSLLSTEFVTTWGFDFRPDVSFSALQTYSSDAVAAIDYVKTVLGTKMDICFDFPPQGDKGGVYRLTDNEYAEFLLTGTGISASSFANAITAAHVQGISTGTGSGWVTVTPEPISAGLILIGGAALAVCRKKKA